ncbi:ssk1 response regulator receiver [Allomyces arbusculus]|nr:ssk1 response regulator receiver [Allomyces arbusculus]
MTDVRSDVAVALALTHTHALLALLHSDSAAAHGLAWLLADRHVVASRHEARPTRRDAATVTVHRPTAALPNPVSMHLHLILEGVRLATAALRSALLPVDATVPDTSRFAWALSTAITAAARIGGQGGGGDSTGHSSGHGPGPAKVDLPALVCSLLGTIARAAEPRRVRVEFACSDPFFNVCAHAQHVSRAVLVALGTAVDAVGSGGRVGARLECDLEAPKLVVDLVCALPLVAGGLHWHAAVAETMRGALAGTCSVYVVPSVNGGKRAKAPAGVQAVVILPAITRVAKAADRDPVSPGAVARQPAPPTTGSTTRGDPRSPTITTTSATIKGPADAHLHSQPSSAYQHFCLHLLLGTPIKRPHTAAAAPNAAAPLVIGLVAPAAVLAKIDPTADRVDETPHGPVVLPWWSPAWGAIPFQVLSGGDDNDDTLLAHPADALPPLIVAYGLSCPAVVKALHRLHSILTGVAPPRRRIGVLVQMPDDASMTAVARAVLDLDVASTMIVQVAAAPVCIPALLAYLHDLYAQLHAEVGDSACGAGRRAWMGGLATPPECEVVHAEDNRRKTDAPPRRDGDAAVTPCATAPPRPDLDLRGTKSTDRAAETPTPITSPSMLGRATARLSPRTEAAGSSARGAATRRTPHGREAGFSHRRSIMDSVVSTSSLGGSTLDRVPTTTATTTKAPAHAMRRRTVPLPPLPMSGGSAPTRAAPTFPTPDKQPTAPAAATPRRAATTAAIPLAARVLPRVRVLIVEDNAINQRILATFLRQRGVAHYTASTGAEAVAQFAAWAPPLVLMDLQLAGGMDGLEATRQMRAVESAAAGTARPPRAVIVALSAGAAAANRRAALAAGCDDYLEKPVNLKWLERRMVEWACMQAIIGYGAAGGPVGGTGNAVRVDQQGEQEGRARSEGRMMMEGTREAGACAAPN